MFLVWIQKYPFLIVRVPKNLKNLFFIYQLKLRAKSVSPSTTDPWISSSDPTTEEEVTYPMGQDRAKAATRKGKGKEGLSTQSEYSSAVGDMMFTLNKLSVSFAKA
jgi:hypothetical protein